jgi:hypothetical protein
MRPSFSDVGNNFKSGEQKTKKLVNWQLRKRSLWFTALQLFFDDHSMS